MDCVQRRMENLSCDNQYGREGERGRWSVSRGEWRTPPMTTSVGGREGGREGRREREEGGKEGRERETKRSYSIRVPFHTV